MTKYKLDLHPSDFGLCEACGISSATQVDHDHSCCKGRITCGQCVRGFVCRRCNLTMRDAKDDIEVLKAVVRYLESH